MYYRGLSKKYSSLIVSQKAETGSLTTPGYLASSLQAQGLSLLRDPDHRKISGVASGV